MLGLLDIEMEPEWQVQRPVRELATRGTDGLQVQLLWCAADDIVFVRVDDQRTGDGFSVPVRRDQSPLEVFNHPYAYASPVLV